ncbi:MAG: flagellar basal-body MS-ring/collar protein FliF [Vampirovibrionales bacterium]|nr:flagellar basal-body MS-ring/collar protein FliF [Vampirovibrionales bacterium]
MVTQAIQQNMQQAGSQVGALWQRLSFGQKIAIGTLSMAVIFATVFFINEAQNDYDVLYSNLSVPDAAATVAKLKESNTPYKLADGGTTVLVPRDRKNELVLDTASELTGEQPVNLGKIPPVLPGEVQREWIRKVNSEAIEEILESIEGVRQAKVIVSLPQETVFQSTEKAPSASVMIISDPGFRLRLEHIKTIKNLVAHAVPGLTPEQVVIADNMGRSLESVGQESNPDGLTESDIRRVRYEEEMKKKIEMLLIPIVGQNNAVVAVSAKLNFDQTQARIKRIIPQGGTPENPSGVLISQQSHLEEYSGDQKKAQEATGAGVQSNVTPTYQASNSSADKKDGLYKSQDTTSNFAHSEEEKSIVYAPGTVEKISISVVLNKVLTKSESQEIKEAVANAAGVDATRGDSVDVKGFQFSESPEQAQAEAKKAVESAEQQSFWLQIAYFAAIIILGLAALLVVYNLLKKPLEGQLMGRIDAESPEGAMLLNATGANGYAALTEGMMDPNTNQPIMINQADSARYALGKVNAVAAELEPELELMRESIHQLVREEPEEAARVIKTFLRDM